MYTAQHHGSRQHTLLVPRKVEPIIPEVFSSYVVRDYYWCVSHQCSSTFLAVKLWCIKKPQEVYLVRRSRVSVRERGEGRQGVSCMVTAMLNVTKENIKL